MEIPVKTYVGTEGASLGAVAFPAVADSEVVGVVIINPTGTGNFVGGTTPPDDSTVVPNAVYVNTVGEFFPQHATLHSHVFPACFGRPEDATLVVETNQRPHLWQTNPK